jgi:acyl-CoA thioester hydrolase
MDWPFEHEIDVRYRDLDTYGHVNNAVYATYCEQARAVWIREVLGIPDMDEFSGVVANLELDFRRSVVGTPNVTVGVRLADLGESSFTLEYRIAEDGETMVEARSTQVHIDREARESRPVPEEWRRKLEPRLKGA